MMVKKETAEEKLLKIIEASKKAKGISSTAAIAASSVGTHSRRSVSISIRQINIFLMAALLAGFLFLVNEIRSGNMMLSQGADISVDVVPVRDAVNSGVPPVKNISYYLDKMASRNIFQPYDKKAAEQKESVANITLQTKMAKYKVVGVAWLDVPESATVMVEDIAKKETSFLREGDKIDDVKVKTIYTDRVVFSYANEEITIKL